MGSARVLGCWGAGLEGKRRQGKISLAMEMISVASRRRPAATLTRRATELVCQSNFCLDSLNLWPTWLLPTVCAQPLSHMSRHSNKYSAQIPGCCYLCWRRCWWYNFKYIHQRDLAQSGVAMDFTTVGAMQAIR